MVSFFLEFDILFEKLFGSTVRKNTFEKLRIFKDFEITATIKVFKQWKVTFENSNRTCFDLLLEVSSFYRYKYNETIKMPIEIKISDVETYRNNLIFLYPSKIDDYFRIHKCYHIRSRIQHIFLSNMLLITS